MPTRTTSEKASKWSWLRLSCILVAGLLAALAWYFYYSHSSTQGRFIYLKDLPGITPETLMGQGTLFSIAEPLYFDPETKLAQVSVQILSTEGFESETHLRFGCDAQSLHSFVKEVKMVNEGASLGTEALKGAQDGVTGLVEGVWEMARHPLDTAFALKDGSIHLSQYLSNTPAAQIKKDVSELAEAFLENRMFEAASSHDVDYFDLKTSEGLILIKKEAFTKLGGQASVEILTMLIPVAQVKVGGKATQMAKVVVKAAKVGGAFLPSTSGTWGGRNLATLIRAAQYFPNMGEKMESTYRRLNRALPPSPWKRTLQLGKASHSDYRLSFFTSHPQLKGQVVVHHALEQQTLTRYPGIFSSEEIHSLENLRGIPLNLDSTLHKSILRKEWDSFYRSTPATQVTRQSLLDKATEMDRKFGHLFVPTLP